MASTNTTVTDGAVPAVGKREPCPCGSGKRYKICHGKTRRAERAPAVSSRTFEGLPGEGDFVALRDIVQAGTLTLPTTAEHGAVPVTFATVLPMAAAAMRRADGSVWVGLQVLTKSEDVARDLGAALEAALAAEPGTMVESVPHTGDRPRLQDLLDCTATPSVRVYESFDFWRDGETEDNAQLDDLIKHASEHLGPHDRLTTVDCAYWCEMDGNRFVRWAMCEDEDRVLDALARLHADRANTLAGEHSKYLGAFRAHGVMVLVWDVPADWSSEDVEDPAAQWFARYEKAFEDSSALTAEQRRARGGIVSRQLTIR